MKKILLIACLMLASSAAFAGVYSDGRGGYYDSHGEACDRHGNPKPPKTPKPVSGGNSTSSATGGNATASSNQTQNQNQSQTQSAVAGATAAADVSGVGNGSNNVNINQPKAPVSTAYAASLTSGLDTCLGSVAGGVQTQILGLSGGGTKVDKNCVLIKQVQLLQQLGFNEAACFRARAGEEGRAIDDALKSAGVDCKAKPVVPVTPADPVTHEELNKVIKKTLEK
jgi:hypothetical protein